MRMLDLSWEVHHAFEAELLLFWSTWNVDRVQRYWYFCFEIIAGALAFLPYQKVLKNLT